MRFSLWRTTRTKSWDKPFPEKLSRRVGRVPTAELSTWAEQAINELGRCLSLYEKSRNPIYLEEALTGAEALNAVVSELHSRVVIR